MTYEKFKHNYFFQNENMLDIKLSSSPAQTFIYDGVEGRGLSFREANPMTLKVELSGHALKVFKIGFGELTKVGLMLEFFDVHLSNPVVNHTVCTATSSGFFCNI